MNKVAGIQSRLEHEKKHGRFLHREGAEAMWNWSSPAGRRRAERRAGFIARELMPSHRALEVGCGTGLFTRLVAHSGADIVATDLSADLLAEA